MTGAWALPSDSVKERAIILVKVERPGSVPEVLVYSSPSWRTRLFYNTALRANSSVEEKCKSSVGEVFRISAHQVQIDERQGRRLVVRKRSQDPAEADLGVIEYRYVVQPVTIDGLPRSLLNDGHAVGRDGYDYSFVSLASLKHDSRTMEVNGKEVNFVSRGFGGNTLRLINVSTFAAG